MVLSTLTAISPVDGRYRNKAENLAAYFQNTHLSSIGCELRSSILLLYLSFFRN